MAGAPEGAKNGPKEWEAGIPQTQPAKHSASLLQKCPLKSSCNCIRRKRGTREIRGGGGRGSLNFQQKQRMEEKRQKRKRGREP